MKKLILIVALSAALLCLCVSMLGISWLSIRQIGISGETIPLVSVGAEATEEKILEVNSPATLEVRISNGSFTISIPADTVFDINLKTDYGNIKAAIPVTFSGDIDLQHWVGSINGGGESLAASTSSGNIRIEAINP